MNVLLVGVGGAMGAMLRYGISLIPFKQGFPVATFVTNLLGAFFIGLIASQSERLGGKATLLLKTGVCGGFTTFSTFSLEAFTLLEQGKTLPGILYVILSAVLCLLGVAAGLWIGRQLAGMR